LNPASGTGWLTNQIGTQTIFWPHPCYSSFVAAGVTNHFPLPFPRWLLSHYPASSIPVSVSQHQATNHSTSSRHRLSLRAPSRQPCPLVYVNIMHFIKQRAATTGSYLKSQLAKPSRPPSNPNLEPRLSYKGTMLNIPGLVTLPRPDPQASGNIIPGPQQITRNQAIQPTSSQNLQPFHNPPPPPTRACTTGWLASLHQNSINYGGRFAAPPAPLTRPHIRPPPGAMLFVYIITLGLVKIKFLRKFLIKLVLCYLFR